MTYTSREYISTLKSWESEERILIILSCKDKKSLLNMIPLYYFEDLFLYLCNLDVRGSNCIVIKDDLQTIRLHMTLIYHLLHSGKCSHHKQKSQNCLMCIYLCHSLSILWCNHSALPSQVKSHQEHYVQRKVRSWYQAEPS